MPELTLEQALEPVRNLHNPTLDQLRDTVASTSAAQVIGNIPKVAILYTGYVAKDYLGKENPLKLDQIAKELVSADIRFSIIDNTRLGEFINSKLFTDTFSAAAARSG